MCFSSERKIFWFFFVKTHVFVSGHEPEKIQNLQWISNQLVSCFGMAGDTKNTVLVSTALDGLHKLLAYKWIRGSFHDEEDPEHRKLIDK
jgi:hypothetical protein